MVDVDDEFSQQNQTASYGLRTRESDEEGDAAQDSSDTGSDASGERAETSPAADHDGFQDGMLARDLPKRTTFYDPVAERQMSQTDAKLFYQRSKIDVRGGSGSWSQSTPHGSPVIYSGSRPPTEYGGDSLILDQDGGEPSHPREHRSIDRRG